MPLTTKQKKVFAEKMAHKLMACPRCESSTLDADDYDGGRTLSCRVTCAGCGLQWEELYRYEQSVNFREAK